MKNRRNVVIVFLLVAVLCLGIGFATLVDNLYIRNQFSFSDQNENFHNEDIFFTNAKINEDETNKYVKISKIKCQVVDQTSLTPEHYGIDPDTTKTDSLGDNDVLTITVQNGAFFAVGQKAVIEVDIKNNTDYEVTVAVDGATSGTIQAADAENPTYEVTIEIPNTTIAAQGKQTVKITIELKGLDTVTNQTLNFRLKATATELNTGE